MRRSALIVVVALAAMGCGSHQPARLEDCREVAPFIPGPEDIEIDPDTSPQGPRLIISGAERRFRVDQANGLYALPVDPNGSFGEAAMLAITERDGMPCRIVDPHGLSISGRLSDGKRRLYVINHRACDERSCTRPFACESDQSIERYRVEEDRLVFERRYFDELLLRPNDLAVSDDGQDIYVSNTTGAHSTCERICEFVKSKELSQLVWHHDDSPADIVPRNSSGHWKAVGPLLAYGNGVTVSRDGDFVYVAAFLGNSIHVYARDREGGLLVHKEQPIKLEASPDNLMWGECGRLYAATHPSSLQFGLHFFFSSVSSPSTIVAIDPTQESKPKIVLETNGQPVNDAGTSANAVSVAVPFGQRLFLGKVLDHGLVSCAYQPSECSPPEHAAPHTERQPSRVPIDQTHPR